MNAELERRIAAAFASDVGSADVAALIAETQAAITDAEAAAEAERAKAHDLLSSPDAAKARAAMEDAAFKRDRLRTVLPRLQARLTEVQTAEYAARWEPDYVQVQSRRDELAQEYAATYPKLVAELVDLFGRVEAVDKEVGRINGSAADGEHRRLLGVELTARGLNNFGLANPSIAAEVRLPDYERSTVLAWPPPQVPLGVQYVASMAPLPHPGSNWQEHAKRRGQAMREEAARMSEVHAERERIREENNAREQRAWDERRRNE